MSPIREVRDFRRLIFHFLFLIYLFSVRAPSLPTTSPHSSLNPWSLPQPARPDRPSTPRLRLVRAQGALRLAAKGVPELLQHVVLEGLGHDVAGVLGKVWLVGRFFKWEELVSLVAIFWDTALDALFDWTVISFVVVHACVEVVGFLEVFSWATFDLLHLFFLC